MIKLKDLLKEEKEQLNERIKTPFMVHPTDPDQTERHWVKVFKELAKGHGAVMHYGPRESDMYDWNSRANYQAATKEYHAHMTKVAKKLNTATKELDGLYGVWDKILKKHRKNDGSTW